MHTVAMCPTDHLLRSTTSIIRTSTQLCFVAFVALCLCFVAACLTVCLWCRLAHSLIYKTIKDKLDWLIYTVRASVHPLASPLTTFEYLFG